MLNAQDRKDIAELMHVIIESEITPKLNLLVEGQQTLLETLAPKSRVEELEDEVSFLKSVIRMHRRSSPRARTAGPPAARPWSSSRS